MKNIFLVLFITISSFCFSQSIKIVQLKNGGIIIESTKNNDFGMGISWKTDNKSFYAGPNGKKSLISGIQKAIEWAELNETYNKEFEKEITRIRVMEKESFMFYKEFISQFSEECQLNFYGYDNGNFKVVLEFPKSDTRITLTNIEDLRNLKNILNGKSGNSEIDDIFK